MLESRSAPPAPARRAVSRRALLGAGAALAVGGVGWIVAARNRRAKPPANDPDPDRGPVPPAVLVPQRDVTGRASAVAVSDDGRWLAVALTYDERPQERGVKLFDRAAGAAPEVWWKWRDTECRGVAFSPNGKWLAVAAGGSGRVRVWSFAEQKEIDLPGATFGGVTRGVAFAPDGKRLAAAIDQWDDGDRLPRPGLVRVWNLATGAPPRDLSRLNFPTRTVAFANDSTTLVAGMSGRVNEWTPSVEVWDAATAGHLQSLTAPQSTIGPAVACARAAPLCVTTDREGVKVYRLPSFKPHEHELPTGEEATAIAVRPDGAVVAFALGGTVGLWDVLTGRTYKTFDKHAEFVSALTFTNDGATLIDAADRTVREWPAPNPD
ncbi:MAG: hypothetical protein FJ304_26845 [Planctomycetes bacterium]|nr:hypothetical protein [Planctomycetota bacterium]